MAPLACIPGVEIFSSGIFHAGTPEEVAFSDQDLDLMVANHRLLSAGNPATYRPPVKLGKLDPHKGPTIAFEEGNPAAGLAVNLRREGHVLKCDFIDVPMQAAVWIRDKLFRKVSAEIDRPARGEFHPDFKETKGPVLKAVALLGSAPPAVKGLKDIPAPQYQFAGKRSKITVFCFSEVNTMDPAMAAFLTSKGLDPNSMDPATIIAAWMKEAAGAGGAAPIPAAHMSGDPGLKPNDPANNNPAPAMKTMSANDLNGLRLLEQQQTQLPPALRGNFSELAASISYLQESVKSTQALNDRNAQNSKRAIVNTFCEQMSSGQRPVLTPADVECDKAGEPLPHTTKARLLRADHTKVHTFAENGATVQKTELELQMEEIRRRLPLAFSERMRQTNPGEPANTDPVAQATKQAQAYAEKRNKQLARGAARIAG